MILDITSSNSLNAKEREIYLSEVNRVLKKNGHFFVRALCKDGDKNAQSLLKKSPGKDYDTYMSLKRAFLLVIMLYRKVQWFKNEIDILPVPADYQIPKMLEGLGCINYDYILSEKIQNGELILAGSLEECEIRAATMLTGRRLAELSGHTMADVDTYLWLKRNEINKPFHLTITTNY